MVRGLIYGSLAFAAFKIVFMGQSASSGGSDTSRGQTAMSLSQPFGQWLVGLIGVASAGYGFYCIY